jgi:DNA-binding response OmpR family regulator
MSFGRISDEMLILLVEDSSEECSGRSDRSVRFSRIAKSLNFRVNQVSDCREAIDCLGTSAYAFLFLDIVRTDLESLACIKSIRMNDSRLGRSTPIIALVDDLNAEETMRLRSSGVSDFLEKPFSAQKLKNAVVRWTQAIA